MSPAAPLSLPLQALYRSAAHDLPAPWLLVLMHGVGSNERDLMGLAPFVPPAFHVLSLRAPFTLAPGSYAWFEFDVLPDGSRRIDDAQEEASRARVDRTVREAAAQLGVPARRVVVGGFSQGGIMSLTQLITQPDALHGAMVLHSRLLHKVEPLAHASALAGKALWVSHGSEDAVIAPSSARHIRERMAAWGVEVAGADYPGGHEIRREELDDAMDWLQNLARTSGP